MKVLNMSDGSLINRYTEIGNVLVKHGFGHFLDEVGLLRLLNQNKPGKDKQETSEGLPYRLRRVLEDLGPTFIKLGQLLSTRTDLLPPEYINQLSKLQEDVLPIKKQDVLNIIERELGNRVELIFQSFDWQPVASASIGQVHKAWLSNGTPVAVKIKRPGIENTIKGDLKIMQQIALVLDRYRNWNKLYNFSGLVSEFSKMILGELDFYQEGENTDKFYFYFQDNDDIIIPKVYWSYTTRQLLTLEYIEGIKLGDPPEVWGKSLINRQKAAAVLTNSFLDQVFKGGFFHGDPHPGNIAFLPPSKVAYLDFGTIGKLPQDYIDRFSSLLMGMMERDIEGIIDDLSYLGVTSPNVDRTLLRQDIERLHDNYFEVPLSKVNIGKAVEDLLMVCFKHQIRLPTQFSLLARALVNLEGTVSQLDPDFSIALATRPFSRELLKNKLSRDNLKRKLYFHGRKYLRLFERLPDDLTALLSSFSGGELHLKTDIVQLELLLNKLSGMINRLSFSIVLAAIIIGLSFLLQQNIPGLFGGLPIAEIGLVFAGVMGFWLLVSILRSGRF